MSVLSLLGSKKTIIKLFKEFDRVLKKNGRLILDINTKKSKVSNKKKEKIKRSFTYVVDDYIETYCVGSKKQFTQLVKPFFNIIDVGFSKHQLFKKEISEFIICCEKKKIHSSFSINLSEAKKFAKISGDFNKIHLDKLYGLNSFSGEIICHGCLVILKIFKKKKKKIV